MSMIYGIYMTHIEPAVIPPARFIRKDPVLVDGKPVVTYRHLRMQGHIRCNLTTESYIPELRLSGLWLRKLGFEAGLRIKVTEQYGKLTLEVDEEAQEEEPEEQAAASK